jgi:hypothetical protein
VTEAAEPDRSRLLHAADEAYARAGERLHGELQLRQPEVRVEGPPALTAAAFEAEGALLLSRAEVYRWIRVLRQGSATEEHERAAEDALLAVHHHFVSFLNAASAALADDGLGQVLSGRLSRTSSSVWPANRRGRHDGQRSAALRGGTGL